jgi:membrane protein required for colicin V production
MFLESSLDGWVTGIFLLFAVIGLFRGFLREAVSIGSWYGAFQLTLQLKPITLVFLQRKISTPFLADIISNAFLFVFFMILLTALGNYLVHKINRFLPLLVNGLGGMLVGFLKGGVLAAVLLSCLNILYRNPKIQKPQWLSTSLAYSYFADGNGKLVAGLEKIFGDLIREEKSDEESLLKDTDTGDSGGKDVENLLETVAD